MDVTQEEREAAFSLNLPHNYYDTSSYNESNYLEADYDEDGKYKRKRGRPPKNISNSRQNISSPQQTYQPFLAMEDDKEKRKRGRPRKYESSEFIVSESNKPWKPSSPTSSPTDSSTSSMHGSINSVRSIPCFYRHCNFSYKRPNSNITEQSDRPLPLPEKFGTFTIRSCKKHCDQWKKMRSDGITCEICRGLNIEEGDNIQTYNNMYGRPFVLCEYCASAQAVPLSLSGAVDETQIARTGEETGFSTSTTTQQETVAPAKDSPASSTSAHISSIVGPDTSHAPRQERSYTPQRRASTSKQPAATESYEPRKVRRSSSYLTRTAEENPEISTYLDIERRKNQLLTEEIQLLRQQFDHEKAQKEAFQKQLQNVFHELETQRAYSRSLEGHAMFLQNKLQAERSRIEDIEKTHLLEQVKPEDVALLSDINSMSHPESSSRTQRSV